MGKRKERRLAAKSNAGRRVKLDLFAEPSGDLGGSTVHDEVGADVDSKLSAGLPNSPSSSGQRPENPLLLLGQYSDDEVEEDSNERPNNGAMENSSPRNDDKVMGPPGDGSQHVDVNADDDHATCKVKQREVEKHSASLDVKHNHEGGDKQETDATTSCDFHKDLDLTEQVSISGTSYTHPLGDVSSGWQIVMHEESNQYYYWNTETGETSWEIPEVLSQATEMASEQKTPAVTAGMEKASVDTKNSNLTLSVKLDSSAAKTMDVTSNLMYGHGYKSPEWNGEKNEALKDENWGNDVINSGASAFNPLSGDRSSTTSGSEKFMSDKIGCEAETNLSLNLVKYCEFLLERLKSLKGSKGQQESLDCVSKYILEVEIRLSDIKSLLSFGSLLLPFWVHSEKQLKHLESFINDEACKFANSAQIDKVEANDISLFREEDKLQGSSRHESEVDGTGNNVFFSTSENSHVSTTSADMVTVIPKDPDATNASSTNCEHVSPLASPTKNIERFSSEQVRGAACPYESKAGEDVDMDVDMEVEDANSAGNAAIADVSGAKEFSPPKQPNHPNPPVAYASIVIDDVFPVPPPPDEEWIPPPPPDNEQVPPPPPDDPPEPLYPLSQSYPATGLPPYAEQYNLSYPNSGYEYYGHSVAEVPSGNFYGHADGSQVAIPQATIYYGAVPNTYTETAQVIVNPAEPVPYYEIQDGTLPPAPIVSIVEAPQFHTEAAQVSYDTPASEQSGFVGSSVEAGQNSLSTTSDDISTVGGETERAPMDVLSSAATIQASATVSTKEAVPVLQNNAGSSAATVTGTSAVTKVQSKVTRNKKRSVAVAPSLRSNKKVSSLVDKWKAAKEELLEDEEEPENAYEMLERKRQREIEEWRAQQIASGEAKDNANFQPLGGDWRERVKRRRAQLASETAQTQTESPNDENQHPDLTELSKDLPSGWQAFWDESSKQVYYGNVLTSETTWTRPSK